MRTTTSGVRAWPVAVLALMAAGLFETPRLRRRYGLRTADWFKA